jgi:hypothetical protein
MGSSLLSEFSPLLSHITHLLFPPAFSLTIEIEEAKAGSLDPNLKLDVA